MGLPHCRKCAKSGSKQMLRSALRQPPLGILKKKIKREFFILGGVGSILMAVASCLIGYYMLYLVHNLLFAQNLEWFVMASVLMSVGLVLTGLGCYGFYYNLGVTQGLIASVLMIISALFFPISIIFSVASMDAGFSIGPEYAVGVMSVGISLILMGAAFSRVCYIVAPGKLESLAGKLNVIVGLIFITVLFAIFFGLAYFALIIASLISAVMFLKIQIPREISTPLSGSTKKEEEISLKGVGE
jgi:hypothetical protein